MDRWIINSPRWLILVALVYAPWAYGSTRPWTITGLNWILGTSCVLWTLSHLLQQRWPKFNLIQLIATSLLIGQAWFMVLNARYDYDRINHEFLERSQLIAFAPGSLDRELSLDAAVRLTCLLLAGLVVSEMAGQSVWRRRLLVTTVTSGCSIAMLGLAQRFTGAAGIFWANENFGPNFFATFRNHTNAGAFLNLIWPLAVTLAVREKLKEGKLWRVILWTSLAVLALTGVMVNTSRAANAIAAGLLLFTGVWLTQHAFRGRFGSLSPATLAATVVLLVAAIGALAFMTGVDANLGRWRQFGKQFSDENTRLLAAQACLKMIPEASWWGFGPGTFETAFPYFTAEFGDRIRGRWIYAHEDYLQTLTEWGLVGFAGWTALLGGAVVHSWRHRIRHRQIKDKTRATHLGMQVALAGVFLHALVDFPLQIASIQLYTITLLGLLWSAGHWMKSDRERKPVHRRIIPRPDLLAAV